MLGTPPAFVGSQNWKAGLACVFYCLFLFISVARRKWWSLIRDYWFYLVSFLWWLWFPCEWAIRGLLSLEILFWGPSLKAFYHTGVFPSTFFLCPPLSSMLVPWLTGFSDCAGQKEEPAPLGWRKVKLMRSVWQRTCKNGTASWTPY